ncbi:hypothetical protein H671_1g2654 [Cricetulus griseus]|uniref:Uncharacterized protein n=1 Tax=Cricetulus griseus TaxID=10029 RepID=A0A061INE2_CRIGR|nr:hypothetical protein H671_1g2654 [Cricetulus griseus]
MATLRSEWSRTISVPGQALMWNSEVLHNMIFLFDAPVFETHQSLASLYRAGSSCTDAGLVNSLMRADFPGLASGPSSVGLRKTRRRVEDYDEERRHYTHRPLTIENITCSMGAGSRVGTSMDQEQREQRKHKQELSVVLQEAFSPTHEDTDAYS